VKIKVTSIYVHDQEKALRFYTDVLGFVKKGDITQGPFRWLTVAHPKPRISVLTLGVDDLKRSLKVYRDGLGLESEGLVGEEIEYGAVVFIDLQYDIKLALWPRKSIAHDTGLSLQKPSATEFTVGHN
jgi:catechol 2,3-dioxygenase-like lactoylglutathione lyase family enzyme